MRVLDDLEIRVEGWVLEFGRLEYVSDRKCFFMWVRKNLDEREIGKTLIHEMEHYDITKTLLSMNIQTLPLPETPYPEWVHSKPSGIWSRTDGRAHGSDYDVFEF